MQIWTTNSNSIQTNWCIVMFPIKTDLYNRQDACTGVHSACQREGNGHNLDICAPRRLRLRQGQMQGFLGLKVGGGLNLQIWDLNRAHETERTVFPILQVFSMCRCKLWHKRKHKGYSTNSAMNTLWRSGRKCGYGLRIADKFCG